MGRKPNNVAGVDRQLKSLFWVIYVCALAGCPSPTGPTEGAGGDGLPSDAAVDAIEGVQATPMPMPALPMAGGAPVSEPPSSAPTEPAPQAPGSPPTAPPRPTPPTRPAPTPSPAPTPAPPPAPTPSPAPTPAPLPAAGFLRQQGMSVVDGAGQPVTLRGINLGGWLMWEAWIWGGVIIDLDANSETSMLARLTSIVGEQDTQAFRQAVYDRFITEEDFKRIAELGYNSVRLPFNHRLLEDDSQPYVYREAGFQVLDRALAWAKKYQIYVVLDMHSAPGGQGTLFVVDPDATNLWGARDNEDRTVALWKAIAERYKDDPWLGGYDLLNEPTVLDGQRLVSLYTRILAAIREVDQNHIAFLEGNWAAVIFDMFRDKLDDNMVYSLHQYTLSGRDHDADLEMTAALGRRHQVPLWVGEYGEESEAWVAEMTRKYAVAPEVIGWAPWTWKRTGTDHPTPQELTAPAAWSSFILWHTSGFGSQPSAPQLRTAMQQLLDAFPLSRCVEDRSFVAATLN